MRLIWILFKTDHWRAICGTILGILSGLSCATIVATINRVINDSGAHLFRDGIIFLLCWLGYAFCSVGSAYFLALVSQAAILKLRLDFARRILAAPLQILEKKGGRLFTILIDDINLISMTVERLPIALAGAATVVGCIVYLSLLSQILTLCFLLILAGGGLFYLIPLRRIQRQLQPLREESNRAYGLFQALHSGLKDLLQSGRRRHAFLGRHLEPVVRRQGELQVRIRVLETIFGRWGELYLLLGLAALLFTIPLHGLVTYPVFGSFILAVLFMLGGLTSAVSFVGLLSRVDTSLEEIKTIGIDLSNLDEHASSPPPTPFHAPVVTLQEVRFRYSDAAGSAFVLGPINLVFDTPEIVFIVGGNGGGKSTLLKLLTGLYTPTSGAIFHDSHPLLTEEAALHRELFTVVFSDSHVFTPLLGQEETALQTDADRLLAAMRLESRVSYLDGSFSTTDLSSGQRKRLALVVALLDDRPIYVFDEWAADQDPEFRRLFYHRFLPELKQRGRLVIAITHDETYFDRADRIIRLGEGRILSDQRTPRPDPATS
jgi:putative ATP-binding cassette transporter